MEVPEFRVFPGEPDLELELAFRVEEGSFVKGSLFSEEGLPLVD